VRDGGGGEAGDLKRTFFNFLMVMSLLQCLATVVVWVRSYKVMYGLAASASNKVIAVTVNRGQVFILAYPNLPYGMGWNFQLRADPVQPDTSTGGIFGFDYRYVWDNGRDIEAPIWAIALLLAVPPRDSPAAQSQTQSPRFLPLRL
jgi:hypothetical protein